MKLLQWLELLPQDIHQPARAHPDTMSAIAALLRRDPNLSAEAATQLVRAWQPMYELYCQNKPEP